MSTFSKGIANTYKGANEYTAAMMNFLHGKIIAPLQKQIHSQATTTKALEAAQTKDHA